MATTTDTSLEVSEECNKIDVMRDNYVDLNAGMHDDSIIPVDRLNVAGADQSTHSVLSTNIERDNYVPLDGIKVKHTWDLPTIININARSLNAEKGR